MTKSMPEQWRPIPGYEDYYEASDQGRIKGLARIITDRLGRTRRKPEVIMRPGVWQGHYRVPLSVSGDGRSRTKPVHRLVMLAFVGPPAKGMAVCHNNGDGLDNRLSNLRYDTPSANNFDTVRHGRNRQANKTHCINGHEFTPENTYRIPRGRQCKKCQQLNAKAWRDRQKRNAA